MSLAPKISLPLPKYTPLPTNLYVRPSQNLLEFIPFQQIYATPPESTPPSQNILTLFINYNIMRPPRIYPPPPHFQQLYETLPESTPPSQNIPPPPFNNYNIMRPSHNVPLPHKIHPPSNKFICATLPKSTTSSLPPSLPEYTPLFNNYMRPSRNLPLLPRIYPLSTNSYVRPYQNLTLPLRITPLLSTAIRLCDPPRICPALPEYTPPPFNNYKIMRPSQYLPFPPPPPEYVYSSGSKW